MSQGPVCLAGAWAEATPGTADVKPNSVSAIAARAASFPPRRRRGRELSITGKRLIARSLLRSVLSVAGRGRRDAAWSRSSALLRPRGRRTDRRRVGRLALTKLSCQERRTAKQRRLRQPRDLM